MKLETSTPGAVGATNAISLTLSVQWRNLGRFNSYPGSFYSCHDGDPSFGFVDGSGFVLTHFVVVFTLSDAGNGRLHTGTVAADGKLSPAATWNTPLTDTSGSTTWTRTSNYPETRTMLLDFSWPAGSGSGDSICHADIG